MKKIWQVCLTTTAEAEEAAQEALAAEFGAVASCYTDSETHVAQVSVYLEQRPPRFAAAARAIRARLQAARRAGLHIGPGTLQLRPLKRENWAEAWKRHFKPLSIGRALLLKPSWSQRRPQPGQKVIVLDPGLSFGTGHHATTGYCLREVVRFGHGPAGAMLDMGTGSGILAIAAAKLGAGPVVAFDFDPEAVRVARENARRNRVFDQVRITRADLTQLPPRTTRRYALVCANLLSTLLIGERDKIIARVAPHGTLVLAGILHTEFDQVRSAFTAAGLRLVRQRTEKEWTSGTFVQANG
jgi:ribosomal protein L11 methyltransferase